MASYTRPGVFVNQSLTPLTTSSAGIPGAAVACFAGAFNVGPDTPTLITSWQQFVTVYGGFSGSSYLPYAVYQYFNNGGTACYVLALSNTDATAATSTVLGVANGADFGTGVLIITASSPGAWGNNLYYEIVSNNPNVINPAPESPEAGQAATVSMVSFTLNIYKGGTNPINLVESWSDISLDPTSARNAFSIVNSSVSGSQYVKLSVLNQTDPMASGWYTAGETDPMPTTGETPSAIQLGVVVTDVTEAATAGSDGSTAPTLATAVPQGIQSLTANGQLLNLNLPAITDPTTINAVIAAAETQGNTFVVVDGQYQGSNASSSAIANYYAGLVGGGTAPASTVISGNANSAIYGPWISISDPNSGSVGATRWVPPGGAVLGYWALNDATYNVSQAPAGVQAKISAVALEAQFTPTDLSTLETAQINPIKLVPNNGYCIFGARTLATGYPNRYVNVSRTLLQFTHDFIYLTQFAIFQNNDPTLWASITTVLTNYLTQAMQAGMLAGTTAATSFAVVCDDTINTSATAQAGLVNANVQVALVSPAEFIVINLSQMQAGATASVSS